jgi:hypothetical protein
MTFVPAGTISRIKQSLGAAPEASESEFMTGKLNAG